MLDRLEVLEKNVVDVRVNRPEVAFEVGQQSLDLGLGNGDSLPMMSRIRFSSPGPKRRVMTRLGSGSSWIGNRVTCTVIGSLPGGRQEPYRSPCRIRRAT